ncbi:stabilizer of axonemal microtubules 3-like [Rhopilema esculentum]|uniref:stabilizer of axonemal microtubules 3-like n=1 Tax=Rhopilema esculentum TaxID=499914 RepID=UPI0031DCB858
MAMTESRNDLHLTSTGVAHGYNDNLPFPPSGFQRTVLNVLPPPLAQRETLDQFSTTTGTAHNYKPSNTSLSNTIHKKAPGHWNVGYVEDLIKKLQVKPWRQPLTMGNQSSEMKAEYTGIPGVSMSRHFCNDIQPPTYRHHHTGGPLKKIVPSTQNKELMGQKYLVPERGVFSYHGDMYLTTTQKNHRAFTKVELGKYPQKEYATYWECESYPKAWGHGSKTNPLPPNTVKKEKGPMRDEIWFKTPTVVSRIPKSLEVVPNKGLCSEVMANFTSPNENKREELFHCPVPSPWTLSGPGPEEIFSVPHMYKTEYGNYGSRKPISVT